MNGIQAMKQREIQYQLNLHQRKPIIRRTHIMEAVAQTLGVIKVWDIFSEHGTLGFTLGFQATCMILLRFILRGLAHLLTLIRRKLSTFFIIEMFNIFT